MSLFMSESELEAASDIASVVERADAHIQGLLQQLEAHKARTDAATITTEQRCSVVEQKFLAMSSQFKRMEHEKAQMEIALERRSGELAQAQAQVHKLELESMKNDTNREHLLCELNEVRKSRRELLDLVEQKNAELSEKNSYIKTSLDKIVFLTDERGKLEAKVRELEAEMSRSQTLQARLLQEKELLEQHNSWVNDELTEKVNTLLQERHASANLEMELQSKLSKAEQSCKEMEESLQRRKEQIKELDSKQSQLWEDLKFTKEDSATKVDHLLLEVETATKLAELYKQSAEEWSKKSADLEGVIKALEVHLNQVEAESKERLEREREACKASEKSATELKEKLVELEKEVESYKKEREQDSFLMISTFPNALPKQLDASDEQMSLELHGEGAMLPLVPSGVSGTTLAATLLRDGWSITKVYVKYQEAVDAWRHERQERKQAQVLLQRVLHEIEQRADLIMDERAKHARMVEAYAIMEDRLHSSIEEQSLLENTLTELKAELRKRERDLAITNKESSDLQMQVAVLLKECADVKEGFIAEGTTSCKVATTSAELSSEPTASDAVISDHLLTFKDIRGLVEQNSQLRTLVRSLSRQNEECEKELKAAFDSELKKRVEEAAQKVSAILKKSEEQTELITSLQGMVGMYKRLYAEEIKARGLFQLNNGPAIAEASGEDLRNVIAKSQGDIETVRKEASERLAVLEEELTKSKKEVTGARSERDRLIVEAAFAREQLQRVIKDSEHQRKEMDAALGRNVEFSQMITEYQQRLRENADRVRTVEENSRRLSVQVIVLEKEKELISNAEKRASQELSSLSDRVHRLQATLDNIHTVEEAKESLRAADKKKLEDEINRMQKEWVEMKHELDAERAHSRHLTIEHEQAVKHAMDRVETISKELADALRQVSVAETRAIVAEARCTELESSLRKSDEKVVAIISGKRSSQNEKDMNFEQDAETLSLLEETRAEVEHLREELHASKRHTEQYKQLARMNEEALLQMEQAHNHYKEEAEKMKSAMEVEITSLREKVNDLEKQALQREYEFTASERERQNNLNNMEREILALHEVESSKRILQEQAEERIKALKDELEKEHQLWRTAQNNYERQVLLQAETIRELASISESKGALEKQLAELQEKSEKTSVELTSLKITSEMEKEALISEKDDLIHRLKELDEQNKLLLDRIEATSIVVQEHDLQGGVKVGSEMQDVVRYLRRSKEASDTEISLLKQERLRLQKQLESALHAAEEAQANLRREHQNAQTTLFSEEEFKSLQAQVREMNLLRESNAQLRMENKRNFQECQNLRERAQQEQLEVEVLRKSLREREVELEAAAKDSDMQKAELARWQNRVSQLLEKYKSLDIEDFQKAQAELASIQEMYKLQQAELESAREEPQRLREVITKLEQDNIVKEEKFGELEKRMQDAEGALKSEIEKLKKHSLFMKRKVESLTKERDDIMREKEALAKQLEELKTTAGKRPLGDTFRSEAQIRQEMVMQHEQAQKEMENLIKEKDSRIQTLERTLEREREDLKKEREELRKEKTRRNKDQKLYIDLAHKQEAEKQKLLEELSLLKREKSNEPRKVSRKIVRPKLDASQHPEASEISNDAAVELAEADVEVQDDTKVMASETSSAVTVSSTPSGLVADDMIGTVRKRPSTMANDFIDAVREQNSKIETIQQPYKRAKGLDLKYSAPETDPSTIESYVMAMEPAKVIDMDLEQVAAVQDLQTLGKGDNQQPDDAIERNLDVNQAEQIMARRPRFSRPDILKRENLTMDSPDEKGVAAQEALAADKPPSGDEEQAVGVLDVMQEDIQGPEDLEKVVSSGEPAASVSQPLSLHVTTAGEVHSVTQESVSLESEGADNLLIDLNDTTERFVASGDLLTSSQVETGLPSGLSVDVEPIEVVETMGDPVLKDTDPGMANEGLLGERIDVEDGEIESEEPENSNMGSMSQQNSADIPDEDVKVKSSSLLNLEVELQQSEEPQSDEKIPPSGESSEKPKETSGSEGSPSQPKVEPDQGGSLRPQANTRQSGKSRTIHLSERAIERGAIRRSGIPPTSPGRRNLRNLKKTLGLRGRATPNEGESQGGADEAAAGASSRAQSTTGANKSETATDDK